MLVAILFLSHILTRNINNMKKQIYIAPEIEVLEVQIEQGFAGSNYSDPIPTDLPPFGYGGW